MEKTLSILLERNWLTHLYVTAGQVAEALHTIHSLQTREDSLQRELEMVRQFLEAAQVEGEEDRIRIMQAEDEMLSLQVGSNLIMRY